MTLYSTLKSPNCYEKFLLDCAMTHLENNFTSKSNVLKFLSAELKKSKIEKIFDFTVKDWKNNQENILLNIQKEFNNKYLIIRSSARGEDSIENSSAGEYLSIQNVSSNSKIKIKRAINNVIKSYKQKSNLNNYNQVLIQTQTTNVRTSGVIFTKTPDLGAPYYVINYDQSTSTTSVTGGLIGNTIKIFRKTPLKLIPAQWKKLITSIQEIEKTLNSNELDIEFAITKNNKI